LPIEVMGASSTTQSVQVNVPSNSALSGPLNLWLQIHGLEYQTEGSVQVNNGAWIPLNNQNVTLEGLAGNYGGIGGSFSTLSMTVALPAGLVQAGTNTINFAFNGTDGNSSGYRVLAFNIQEANGTQLIPASTFTQSNPANWTPPLNDAADISAGQTLYQTATITQPVPGGSPITLKAHCGDCHTQDGRDLKYFNYSNNAIEVRAMFH
jgi:mono/diheme cytochrome c family protein